MRHLLKTIFCISIFNLFTSGIIGQENTTWFIGPEMQVYPTGFLPGVRIEKKITPSSSMNLRLALQVIDHRDLGVHDNEKGNGYGLSIAYRKFLGDSNRGFSLSLRTDYWKNTIDWTDLNPMDTGTSEITVLQPTGILEYTISSKSLVSITPSLGFGYEWNVETIGAPTGEGAILSLGVFVGFQF